MAAGWSEITAAIAAQTRAAGFDLVQPFDVRWYNDAVAPAHRLLDFERPSPLGVLIANTRALWPCFLAALRAEPGLLAEPDPLDRYTERQVKAACAALAQRTLVRFAHEPAPRIAMQRLAQIAGLARLSPAWLSIHPLYGPWIGLRAVVVVDADGPPGPPPALADPCAGCAERCLPLLERARATLGSAPPARAAIAGNWHAWLAIRDACPVGREHRYSSDQIEYHYTWERSVLERVARSGH